MKIKKEAKEYLHYLNKKETYSRDLLSDKQRKQCDHLKQELKGLISKKEHDSDDHKRLEDMEKEIERLFPLKKEEGWTENVEVLFVAVVIALALKAYIVQPFAIPTDSMKPTLWGIFVDPRPLEEAPSNFFQKIANKVVFGEWHHVVEVEEDGFFDPTSIEQRALWGWSRNKQTQLFPRTYFRIGSQTYSVGCNSSEFMRGAPHLFRGKRQFFKKGTVAANFKVTTGDHIFVNKIAYHFRLPKRGEVFVFTTHDIPKIENDLRLKGIEGGQYYIKRCVGVSGDILRIKPPYLYSNGEILNSNPIFEKIYSKENGYHGYVNSVGVHLGNPHVSVKLSEDRFWAMGDNSQHSSDSRDWGQVPRKNLVGTGLVVYWPFSNRWGAIP